MNTGRSSFKLYTTSPSSTVPSCKPNIPPAHAEDPKLEHKSPRVLPMGSRCLERSTNTATAPPPPPPWFP
eukprot:CAMPEP_0171747284 /NCGR_PEP_ID=MMETSP0991-20121206/39351_1 /TAXON_ID=483369 /ORGANISM="non described non described, Strain CCMP2098" /LENGTH=69 /DNA_ID=CAMNT_0012347291 /DNA_START=559 /DNA_END=765 /DNA_ORIENTATION=-